jgi:hypothetical protein
MRKRKQAASTIESGPEPNKTLVRWLETESALERLSWWDRFRTTIDLWFAAFTRNEKEYQEHFKHLGRAAATSSVRVMAELITGMMHEPRDYLGKAYQDCSMNDKRFAQYFTPDSVAKCMAQMQVADLTERLFYASRPFRVGEPAVGTGVMLIHCICAIRDKLGEDALSNLEIVAVDKDILCCKMAALQLKWLGVPLHRVVIWHGDTLDDPKNLKLVTSFGVAPEFQVELPTVVPFTKKLKVPI